MAGGQAAKGPLAGWLRLWGRHMAIAILLVEVLFFLWVVFLGGAELIHGTILEYLVFEGSITNPDSLRVLALVGLVVSVVFYFM